MKNLYYKIGAWISTLPLLLLPVAVSAQLSESITNLDDVGGQLTEDTLSLPELIGGLIQVFLGVLGIIFVVLVVYAGYLWMTAGGETTKVDKAKKLLGQGIIGMVIIIAAYTIADFVITNLVTATGN